MLHSNNIEYSSSASQIPAIKLVLYSILIFFLSFLQACFSPQVTPPSPQELAEARKLVSQGVLYIRQFDAGEALALNRASALFQLAFEMDPQGADIQDGFGCIAWRKGNLDSAEAFFAYAIELDPSYARAWVNRAYIEEHKGNKEIAEMFLQKALEINSFDPNALNNLGGLVYDHASDEHRKEYGRSLIFRARELSPQDSKEIKHNLAIIENKQITKK